MNTAICYWSKEDQCFIVESPLFSRIIGTGDTRKQALRDFEEHVESMHEAYLEGRLAKYDRPGRPATGNVEFHTQLKPAIKDELAKIASEMQVSQGQLIEYLYRCWKLQSESGTNAQVLQFIAK